jgi:hypothetical protein
VPTLNAEGMAAMADLRAMAAGSTMQQIADQRIESFFEKFNAAEAALELVARLYEAYSPAHEEQSHRARKRARQRRTNLVQRAYTSTRG